MNSLELEQFLLTDTFTTHYFGGVIPADSLKNITPGDGKLYVVNTQPSSHPGLHWIVINNKSNTSIEFWDSLGQHPQKYGKYFMQYFNELDYLYNTRRLQGWERTCGHFCLFYAFYRCREYSMETIVNNFTLDIACNDIVVLNFVQNVACLFLRK